MKITIEIIEKYRNYNIGDKITFEMATDGCVENIRISKNRLVADITLPPNVYKLVKHQPAAQ
jgi:hypothetical protein